MYEAFELQRVVDKLPLKICALATWGEPSASEWALNGVLLAASAF